MAKYDARLKKLKKKLPREHLTFELWIDHGDYLEGPDGCKLTHEEYARSVEGEMHLIIGDEKHNRTMFAKWQAGDFERGTP